jgi:RHS repeat-associated protein
MPAARAGDIGIAVTCGSLAPPFEIYTGSSKVFIAGHRAARLGDITQHCNPASSSLLGEVMGAAGIAVGAASGIAAGNTGAVVQAAADAAVMAIKALCGKDPGVPPGIGALIGPPVPTVLIGGFPCPPVGHMAVGGLLKLLKKALAALGKLSSRKGNAHCGEGSHPIYLVTGENFDSFVDFVSGGLFEWRRHYTTARARTDGPHGHGWRHFWQRTLHVRLHRAVFVDWDGVETEFPRFAFGSNLTTSEGYRLERLDRGHYRLAHQGKPTLEFVGSEFVGPLSLAKVTDGKRSLAFLYDGFGRLEQAVERDAASGEERRYQIWYDASGHATHVGEMADRANGHPSKPIVRAAFAYDGDSNLAVAEDALGGRWVHEFDAFHRLTKQTDPRVYTYTFRYDALGRCVRASGQDGLWACKVDYYPDQRLTRYTEGDDATWEYHYDSDGFITKIVDPYGGEKVRERDGEGRLAKETDSGGRVMEWLYDGDGRHHARVDGLGNLYPPETEMPRPEIPRREPPRDAFGWMFAGASVPADSATSGGAKTLLDALPHELYTPARLLFRIAAPSADSAVPPALARDALGRVVRESTPWGRVREWTYDATGNVVTYRDGDGNVIQRKTTSWNLLGERTNPAGQTFRYAYSSLENLTSFVAPGEDETRYDYDLKERLVRVHRHGRVRDEYVYDLGDHFIEKRDGAGATLLRHETHENHLVGVRHLASGGFHRFDYDGRGRVTEASTEEHEVRIAYDARGRTAGDQRDEVGIEHRETKLGAWTFWRSEVLGKVVSTAAADERGIRLNDARRKRSPITMFGQGLVRRECANGTTDTLQFDPEGRLKARMVHRRNRHGRLAWRCIGYSYSAEGDLLAVDDSATGTTRFEVDGAHRLIAAETAQGREEFGHDVASNVHLQWIAVGPGNIIERAYGEAFSHDDRHRMSERRADDGTVTRYAYDSFDLLRKIERTGAAGKIELEWTATYDGLGRRIAARWGDRTREFFWDGDRLAAEAMPDGRLRVYQYATREALVPLGFVEFASREADPATARSFYVFSDPVGMPLWIEDDDGHTVWRAEEVHAFGAVMVAPDAELEYNLRWPGHYFDPETGLHYNRYRYYDPALARYLQPDPLGYEGSPVNLYAYCANPLVDVDVFGLAHPTNPRKSPKKKASDNDGREGVEELEVDSFAALKKREVSGDNLDHDHVPAFASVLARVNRQRREEGKPKLNEAQEGRLRNRLTTVEVDHDKVHVPGRTYGKRGGDARVEEDSQDLREAANKDLAEHRANLIKDGQDPADVDNALDQVHQRNEDIGLYDDKIPSSLWEK